MHARAVWAVVTVLTRTTRSAIPRNFLLRIGNGGLTGMEHVKSKIDTNVDDEPAGLARRKFRLTSESHRAAEAARIAKENRELRQRLLAVKAKSDDGDGLFGSGLVVDWRKDMNTKRLVLEQNYRAAAADWYLRQMKVHDRQHRRRLSSMTSAIDDDTEDDATGEKRAWLRAQSAERRRAEEDALRAANAVYFTLIKEAQTKLDTKVWDDGEGSAGAARSIVAAQSRARREAERRRLEEENYAHSQRLAQVCAKIDDGDGHLDGTNA